MFVGETAIQRVVERTCELMRQDPNEDPRNAGGIDLPLLQRYINFWYSVSADLFGGEISSNAANYFGAGLKGRDREAGLPEHRALDQYYTMSVLEDGKLAEKEVPMRNAMNEVLRDSYIGDCQRGCDRWNRIIEQASIPYRLTIPDRKFNRRIGIYAGHHFTPQGQLISEQEWKRRQEEWLPGPADREFVEHLMVPVYEPGKIANWIAPPERGINGQPFEFEYARFARGSS